MINSTEISKAIEQEVKRTNEPTGKPPVTTKEMTVDTLEPRPVETIESNTPEIIPSDVPAKGKSYVDINFGGSAPASAVNTETTAVENENRKKYIQYGAILFIVLFLMLIVLNLKKNK